MTQHPRETWDRAREGIQSCLDAIALESSGHQNRAIVYNVAVSKPIQPQTPGGASLTPIVAVTVYVAAVLGVDTLAAHGVRFIIDWRVFLWQSENGFDLFKFMWWFVVPFAASLHALDWGAFGVRRWQRIDLVLLGGLVLLGVGAVLIIPYFKSLDNIFHGLGSSPWIIKRNFVEGRLIWTASWLIGWEFLHRYFLLRAYEARWPRVGWLIVPLSEGLYHLQQPLAMAVGMVVFSLILTPWAFNRRNVLLPFLAHLAVELALLGYLVLT